MRALLLALMLLAAPAFAVQPDEMLDDPVLEARARLISEGLRCPVCQGETIDESNASVSRELRLLVRERLLAGDSDEEVVAYIVSRFGEFVLMRPDASGSNLVLWLGAPVMLLLAGGLAFGFVRRRSAVAEPAPLSDEEEARLQRLLSE